MKIKILQSCSGLDFSYGLNEEIEVSAERGGDLVSGGLAEEIKTQSAKPKAGGKKDADA